MHRNRGVLTHERRAKCHESTSRQREGRNRGSGRRAHGMMARPYVPRLAWKNASFYSILVEVSKF